MFLINGKTGDFVSIQDRGLHYGDGVFETIAVCKKNLLCWDKHYKRLLDGCDVLGIACPDNELLQEEAQKILTEDKEVLKIIITRGAGGRGYNPPKQIESTRILASYQWPDHDKENLTKGIKVRVCDHRLGLNPRLSRIKHLNRLEQILARSEWTDPEITEGLMMDQEDNIIEGTMSNLFMVTDNKLITPDLSRYGISGIIRQCIIELAPELDIEIETGNIKHNDLLKAGEIFLCNSIIGIWSVIKIDDHEFNAGPYTSRIREALVKKEAICA